MTADAVRHAECRCGQLTADAVGDPARISACHCLACQRRTGSAFAVQARWPEDRVSISGESRRWSRVADSGKGIHYHFCPECGSTVWYLTDIFPGLIAIPVGAFADPEFPQPAFSVWEQRKHDWVEITGEGIERQR